MTEGGVGASVVAMVFTDWTDETVMAAITLVDYLQLQLAGYRGSKYGRVGENTTVCYDLPGCGWVCFFKILS